MIGLLRGGLVTLMITAIVVIASGCGQKDQGGKTQSKTEPTAEAKKSHDHSGEWCPEHAMPEDVCVQCHPELAAGYKKKGDWCKEHGVPKSQCFACDPALKEVFREEYKAKHGEYPPS